MCNDILYSLKKFELAEQEYYDRDTPLELNDSLYADLVKIREEVIIKLRQFTQNKLSYVQADCLINRNRDELKSLLYKYVTIYNTLKEDD